MSTSYQTVCEAGWRTKLCIIDGNDFHPAYEVHEFPGVVRFEEDHQPVPIELCERMGWKNLAAQSIAIQKQTSAYETLMNL